MNLQSSDTVEFRMFRRTLKTNTFLATLKLVDRVCDVAINLFDEELRSLARTTFVSGITEDCCPELVRYLKERRLYASEPVKIEPET